MTEPEKQLIEVCENDHNYRAAHEHEMCPICGAKVVDHYFIKIGGDQLRPL